MTVSIVMPVRNAAGTLDSAIRSCLEQTWNDFELIIVNDRSSDGSQKIAMEAERRDLRVRIVEVKHPGGLVAALNTGIHASSGEFIARMDADDLMHLERLEAQVKLMRDRKDIAACGTMVEIVGGDIGFERYEYWINYLVQPEQIARERFVESPLVHPSMMIRRSVFDELEGYRDIRWAEDYDLWLRMMQKGMLIAKVPRVLLKWTDSSSRLTRVDDRYSIDNFLRAKAHFLGLIPSIKERGVMISGGGPTGKRLTRFLRLEGVKVHAILEINPRRVGARIAGVPVRYWSDVPPAGDTTPIQIAAVGQAGRRTSIREIMDEAGYTEGVDFFCAS